MKKTFAFSFFAILGFAACQKQAKPTPPASEPAASATAPLIVRVRLAKGNLEIEAASFNRSIKQLRNVNDRIIGGTSDPRMDGATVSIDYTIDYTEGTVSNFNGLRYRINNPDADESFSSSPFSINVRPEGITNGIYITPIAQVTWRRVFTGK